MKVKFDLVMPAKWFVFWLSSYPTIQVEDLKIGQIADFIHSI